MNKNTFGSMLKSTRMKEGLSQEALSILSGISATTITRVETGHSGASMYTACALFNALGYELKPVKKEKNSKE